MNSEIRKTLEAVKSGELSVDDALLAIKKEPFEDIGYAKVDLHRGIRQGAAEVIYGAGKIVEIGTADEIFYDSRHPYTKGLMRALPAASIGKDALYTIPGMPPTLIDPPKGDAFACRNEQALAIDYEEEPPMFWVSDTHFAASWMLDARAQQNVRHSPEKTTSVSVHSSEKCGNSSGCEAFKPDLHASRRKNSQSPG